MATKPSPSVYLDYNATAPLLPAALSAMQESLAARPGNPSSPHRYGQAARAALEDCRTRIAEGLGVSRRELIFTSGGSETNNAILRGVANLPAPVHIIVSTIEHASVLKTCEHLAASGIAVSYLPVDASGRVILEALGEMLRDETRLVSVMTANNETGAIQPIPELVERVRAHRCGAGVTVHTDAVQAFGRIALDLWNWGVDCATVTAHKIGGPKGIGALIGRESLMLPGLIVGGAQERGQRAGTESVFLVEGFDAAVQWVRGHRDELSQSLAGFKESLLEQVAGMEGFFQNGTGGPCLANTVNLGFEGVSAQSLVVAMDLAGVAISTGSACSSGAMEPSHVLEAMNLSEARVSASVRISMGHATNAEEVNRCAEMLLREVSRLRQLEQRAAS